jgi:hypothetical protein
LFVVLHSLEDISKKCLYVEDLLEPGNKLFDVSDAFRHPPWVVWLFLW